MKRSRLPLAAVAVASLLLTAGWQVPQTPPASPPAPSPSSEPTVITDTELKTLLGELGYTVKDVGTAAGQGVYDISIAALGFNIPTRVYLSKSKKKLWLSVTLMTKEDVDKLTREDLQAILAKNSQIGPCHFLVEDGRLKMHLALDNRQITAAILRSEFFLLSSRVTETKSLWQKAP